MPLLVLNALTWLMVQGVAVRIIIVGQQRGDRQHERLVLHQVGNVVTRHGRGVDQLDHAAGAAEEEAVVRGIRPKPA